MKRWYLFLIALTAGSSMHASYLRTRFAGLQALPYAPFFKETPAHKLKKISRKLRATIWIKRDDMLIPEINGVKLFGGNKIRKLSWELPRIMATNPDGIVTLGSANSNSMLATAMLAKAAYDMPVYLSPEIKHYYPEIPTKLRLEIANGASILVHPSYISDDQMITKMAEHFHLNNPGIIPRGASTPSGVLGYVDAALELQAQIKKGLLPEPDLIYVPCGSMGTAIGLAIGCELAGLKTKIVAVRVGAANITRLKQLFKKTVAFMKEHDNAIPDLEWPGGRLVFRTEFVGNGYAEPLPNTDEILSLFASDGIILEATYTAKAAACLLDDIKHKRIGKQKVLFWDTYCPALEQGKLYTKELDDIPLPF